MSSKFTESKDRCSLAERFKGKKEIAYFQPNHFVDRQNLTSSPTELEGEAFGYSDVPRSVDRRDPVRTALGKVFFNAPSTNAFEGDGAGNIEQVDDVSPIQFVNTLPPQVKQVTNGEKIGFYFPQTQRNYFEHGPPPSITVGEIFEEKRSVAEAAGTIPSDPYEWEAFMQDLHKKAKEEFDQLVASNQVKVSFGKRHFLPHKDNHEDSKKFSLMDNTGRPVNKETIALFTDNLGPAGNLSPAKFGGSISAIPKPPSDLFFNTIIDTIKNDHKKGTRARKKEDHSFSFLTPFGPGDSFDSGPGQTFHIDHESRYNFYTKAYENFTKTNLVSEAILPSLLVDSVAETISNNNEIDSLESVNLLDTYSNDIKNSVAEFTTLGGVIKPDNIKGSLKSSTDNYYADVLDLRSDLDSYFNDWTEAIKLPKTFELQSKIIGPYKKQIIMPGGNYYIGEHNNRKTQYPMHNSIKISCPQITPPGTSPCATGQFTTLIDLLDYYDLRYPVLKALMQGNESPFPDNRPFFFKDNQRFFDVFNLTDGEIEGKNRFHKNFVFYSGMSDSGEQGFDYRDWLANFQNTGAGIYHPSIGGDTIIGSLVDSDIAFGYHLAKTNQDGAFTDRYTRCEMFNQSFQDLIVEKTRTYKEILDGKMACTEILGWKIEKFKVITNSDGTTRDELIQEYIIAYPRETAIEFVDTQVKYGAPYKYKVRALVVVYGSEYEYHFPEAGHGETGYTMTTVTVNNVNVQNGKLSLSKIYSLQQNPAENPAEGVSQVASANLSPNFQSAKSNLEAIVAYGSVPHREADRVVTGQASVGPGLVDYRYQLILDVVTRPSVKIVEVPYYETPVMRILDKPPVPPHVEILPYRGKNNNFLINLEEGMGREITAPQGILPEDTPAIAEVYEAQYSNFSEAAALNIAGTFGAGNQATPEVAAIVAAAYPLEFRSDDPPAAYQVFRLDAPPASYLDFAGGEFLEIESEGVSSISLRPGELGQILPNKKYYYTFRTKDVHGHISNPTQIYEIMVVDDSGATYLDIKMYKFPEVKRNFTKTMRRFLNIYPSLEQASFLSNIKTNEDGSIPTYTGIDPKFGRQDEPLFDSGKKYKIRLTSKKTGRKLDINVNFRTKKLKTAEEEIAAGKAKIVGKQVAGGATVGELDVELDTTTATNLTTDAILATGGGPGGFSGGGGSSY